jgi:ABC-2 type transport system ATP-binding protein
MIRIDRVHKRFGKIIALDGVSLTITPGERVALVGSNGSGKTTLLRALCGLLRVEGRIEVFGADVHRHPEVALRALAYLPQSAPPLDAPVAELVRAYAALRSLPLARVSAVAERLGLSLEAVGKSRVRDLSGGMKQKLVASLTLATDVPVLVCDEPTASLDAAARAAFFELLDARPRDGTLILCTHRAEEVAQRVARVITLADGRLVSDTAVRSAPLLDAEMTATRIRRVR